MESGKEVEHMEEVIALLDTYFNQDGLFKQIDATIVLENHIDF